MSLPSGKWFQLMQLFNTSGLRLAVMQLRRYPYFLYYRFFVAVLSILEHCTIWFLCDCSWEHFEYASLFFIVHFGFHVFFPT